jgi:hypothetical protein
MSCTASGDIVAVELLPESHWKGPSKILPGAAAGAAADPKAAGSPGGSSDEAAAPEAEADMAPEIFQVGEWELPVP